MLGPTFGIGKLLGIRIGLSSSWFVIFALVTWALAAGYFPGQHPSLSPTAYWVMGVSASLLFFGSVLLHELSHSVVAIHYGIPVTRITLFIFGGVAQIAREASTPRMEAAIALAGPVASLALAVGFGLAYTATSSVIPPLASVFFWLGVINTSLALFNLVPGFPLDGGRLLRALVWYLTDDYRSATRLASGAGQAIGMMLVGYGFYVAFAVNGGLLSGIWPAMIGMFLHSAAANGYRAIKVVDDLKELVVENVMVRDVVPVQVDSTVEEFVNDYLLRRRPRCFPVMDGDELIGVAGLEDVRKIPEARRGAIRMREVLRSLEQCPPLDAKERGDRAMERMGELGVDQLPVLEGGRLVGMIAQGDLLRIVQARSQLR